MVGTAGTPMRRVRRVRRVGRVGWMRRVRSLRFVLLVVLSVIFLVANLDIVYFRNILNVVLTVNRPVISAAQYQAKYPLLSLLSLLVLLAFPVVRFMRVGRVGRVVFLIVGVDQPHHPLPLIRLLLFENLHSLIHLRLDDDGAVARRSGKEALEELGDVDSDVSRRSVRFGDDGEEGGVLFRVNIEADRPVGRERADEDWRGRGRRVVRAVRVVVVRAEEGEESGEDAARWKFGVLALLALTGMAVVSVRLTRSMRSMWPMRSVWTARTTRTMQSAVPG